MGISKRGDAYLRKLLVHGARAVIRLATHRDDGLSRWVNALTARKHVNVATVALANKTARMAWAIAHAGVDYDPALAAEPVLVYLCVTKSLGARVSDWEPARE